MNLSTISSKTLYGKILRLPLRLIPKNMKLPILQGKLRGKKWIVGSGNHGCWLGSYECEQRLLFEKTIKEDSVVFDIGAHVGFYTLLASELVGPKGEVFAFEPARRNLYFLKKHLQINHCQNVKVIEVAVAEKNGNVYFNSGLNGKGYTGHISTKGNQKVRSVSLDKLIFESKIPIPDFIKIDVEGAEIQVLKGAQFILKEYHPVLFLSTHGEENRRKCCSFLEQFNYSLKPIDEKNIKKSREIFGRKL